MQSDKDLSAWLDSIGARPVREIRREEMLGFWGWLITIAFLVGSAICCGLALFAFCGFLLLANPSEAGQQEVLGFFRFMVYTCIVVIPLGNVIWWWIRWNSYEVH